MVASVTAVLSRFNTEWRRVGARQMVDFTPGVRRTPAVKGVPRSRWLTALGTGLAVYAPAGPSARAVSFILICPPAKRAREGQMYLDQLCAMDAGIARAHGLSHAFLALGWERRGADLEAWMVETMHSGIDDLARFARGLRDDLAAVTAGLTLPWSNGPVEGQITQLKWLKRQSYGRAGFPLLRQRVMQAA